MDAQNISTPPKTVDWEVFYWQWMPRVYNFFRYRTGDDALAEDLTATTFTKAWRSRAQYSDDLSAFSTWLFSIAQNVAVDHFRRQRFHLPLDAVPHLIDPSHSLDEIVQKRRDSAHLAALLARLSARDRELIALKYGAELTNRAIAKLLGMSESNVGTSLHRIIQKLRSQWDQEP
ncbi:MAG TPA: sigma-70 family RNA polymerase sigma factor [Phototrophicaceae bacterium]|nr:sigma-70 family RNA polymerase sigma factor [Phototrophicaceae bacterium]